MDELLGLFRYPPRSGRALLAGTLPLRYCAARFACRVPTWRLPASGHVARLVAIYCEAADGSGDEVLVREFAGLVVLVLGGKEFD